MKFYFHFASIPAVPIIEFVSFLNSSDASLIVCLALVQAPHPVNLSPLSPLLTTYISLYLFP